MIECDFTTEEGRNKTREEILKIVNNVNKQDLADFLFAMMQFIVKHEVNFENIKGVL